MTLYEVSEKDSGKHDSKSIPHFEDLDASVAQKYPGSMENVWMREFS